MSIAAKLIALMGTPPIDYLVAAGGGGGGNTVPGSSGIGGGGGAGGLLTGRLDLARGSYAITVGAGGTVPNNGGDSSIGDLVEATGGGHGGTPIQNGADGGSGGGGSNGGGTLGGSGIPGQGFDAGDGAASGAGAGGTSSGGTPGIGVASSISGSSVTYCKGGPWGQSGTPPSEKGSGGGGSFGGGGIVGNWVAGTPGIDGIVIIRYRGGQRATGGTVTTVGGDTVHTFTSSGTFVWS